jgi:hypothetical protein
MKQIQLDYDDEPNKRKRLSKIKNNPYFNALQVKFAYALTCHKAPGGQWENVFVEMGYIPDKCLTMNTTAGFIQPQRGLQKIFI